MTIQDLTNLALQCLQALPPVEVEPERLRERVLVAHTQRVIDKLLDILEQAEIAPDHVLADLEKLLAQNWQDTQRTMLCYTAIPESNMTRLFIKTAEFVAQSRNSKPQNPEDSSRRPTGVIELLMPSVCTESLNHSYPDLGPYQELAADKTLLWKNPEIDIQKLLVSHVLGTDSYLIPVQLLTELEANSQVRLDNPYFDYKGHAAKHSTIQPAELERLYHHSPETRALKEAYDTCKALTEDKSTLLDHLLHLCRKLHINSVAMQGQENNAGGGAYPAIIAFNDYYTNLAENEKMRIPQEVRTEIDKLLALSSDKKQNSNATANIDTCIATRRREMLATIQRQETTLRNIAVTDERKKELGIAAKERVIQCRDALKTRIETGGYSGNDSFGITRTLLQRLNIQLSIASMPDLQDFLSLEPEEITALGQDEQLQPQLASQVKTLEDWVMLALDTPLQKLGALMGLIGDRLANAFIKKPLDIRALLMTLPTERINVVLDAMNEKLSEMIKNPKDFEVVTLHLDPDQRTAVYLAIQDKLPEMIESTEGFKQVFQYLTPEKRTAVYLAIQNKLPEMIKYPKDLKLVFQYLTPEQVTAVCSAIQGKLPDMIKDPKHFELVFQYLTPEKRTAVYSAIQVKLPDIIQDIYHFRPVFQYLTPEQVTAVCSAMKRRLPNLIKNSPDFNRALRDLKPEQSAAVCSVMEDNLPSLITDKYDFGQILPYLTPQQSIKICRTVQKKLPGLTKNALDLAWVVAGSSPEQYDAICSIIKLHETIKNASDLKEFLSIMDTECQKKFFASDSASALLARIILNIPSDIPQCTDEAKHAFNKAWFAGLLQELRQVASTISDKKTSDALTITLRGLTEASQYYFNSYPQNQAATITFQEHCGQLIHSLQTTFRDSQSLASVLGKILLAIVSFGLAPLASAIKSKYETGVFQCRFFEAPSEREAETISRLSNALPYPKT